LHRELQVCEKPDTKSVVYTDPPMSNFAPVQNAVTMSKLALLNASGLNALIGHRAKLAARQVANPVRRLNTRPYTSRMPMGAVMVGAIRSIDGDHPWQPTAPPLPRSDQSATEADLHCRRYGYPAGDAYAGGECETDNLAALDLGRKSGMILWQRPYRELVFNAVFQPIATSLCDFVGYDFPYASCELSDPPFPEYVVPAEGELSQREAAQNKDASGRTASRVSQVQRPAQRKVAGRVVDQGRTTDKAKVKDAASQTRQPGAVSRTRQPVASRGEPRTPAPPNAGPVCNW
jgi:hypothetical protein